MKDEIPLGATTVMALFHPSSFILHRSSFFLRSVVTVPPNFTTRLAATGMCVLLDQLKILPRLPKISASPNCWSAGLQPAFRVPPRFRARLRPKPAASRRSVDSVSPRTANLGMHRPKIVLVNVLWHSTVCPVTFTHHSWRLRQASERT
jgi:hypothetical protein